jgi:hypothetical protein
VNIHVNLSHSNSANFPEATTIAVRSGLLRRSMLVKLRTAELTTLTRKGFGMPPESVTSLVSALKTTRGIQSVKKYADQ